MWLVAVGVETIVKTQIALALIFQVMDESDRRIYTARSDINIVAVLSDDRIARILDLQAVRSRRAGNQRLEKTERCVTISLGFDPILIALLMAKKLV